MALYKEEKEKLKNLLPSTASIMASSIVKLYLASPDPKKMKKKKDIAEDSVLRTFKNLSDSKWTFTNVMGALIFVIDRKVQTFVFQIYDLKNFEIRYEYELYEDIEYTKLSNQFHCFEMEDAVAGFSFANEDDAKKFAGKVAALRPTAEKTAATNENTRGGKKSKSKKSILGAFTGGKKNKNIEVGQVTNVIHNQHIGIKDDGSFDLANIPSEWKSIFKQAGIRKKDLKNPEIAVEIIQTIAESTGMDLPLGFQQVIEENKNKRAAVAAVETKLEYTEDELKQYYTPQQLQEYEEYQKQLEDYEAQLQAYEQEQLEIAKWEEENEKFNEDHYEDEDNIPPPPPPEDDIPPPPMTAEEEMAEIDKKQSFVQRLSVSMGGGRKGPQLPPRKTKKEIQQEEQQQQLEATMEQELLAERERLMEVSRKKQEAIAAQEQEEKSKLLEQEAKRLVEMESKERRAKAAADLESRRIKAEANAEQLRIEEEKRLAEEIALKEKEYEEQLAKIAEAEQEDLKRQLEEMKERTKKNAEKLKAFNSGKKNRRKSIKQLKPPVPQRPTAPPLPPGMSAAAPLPPPPPKLPPLPSKMKKGGATKKPQFSFADLGKVKLKHTETVDKGVPDITGKRGRTNQAANLLGAIERGTVQLKKVDKKDRPKLPSLKKMDDKAKNGLMSKLAETMNARKHAFGLDEEDEEDDDGEDSDW